ncbi:hypothetical protein GGR56DRAFT_546580 [Xylariaceae sp. FL0804]|nr:hypothetical protein GGR56DRAFT_546580 [Xylariaceae sp. FL0804]
MPGILSLPVEVHQEIFLYLNTDSILNLVLTCRRLYDSFPTRRSVIHGEIAKQALSEFKFPLAAARHLAQEIDWDWDITTPELAREAGARIAEFAREWLVTKADQGHEFPLQLTFPEARDMIDHAHMVSMLARYYTLRITNGTLPPALRMQQIRDVSRALYIGELAQTLLPGMNPLKRNVLSEQFWYQVVPGRFGLLCDIAEWANEIVDSEIHPTPSPALRAGRDDISWLFMEVEPKGVKLIYDVIHIKLNNTQEALISSGICPKHHDLRTPDERPLIGGPLDENVVCYRA